MANEDMVTGTFWVQFEPTYFRYSSRLAGVKAVRMTQSKPVDPLGGTALMEIKVSLPQAVFEPLRAQVEAAASAALLVTAEAVEREEVSG